MGIESEWSTYLSHRHDLQSIEGVNAVGLAGPEVIAYVEKATPELMRSLPEDVGGIPLKVKEVGKLRILSLVTYSASRIHVYRPAPGGVSIGHELGPTGTHGCKVSLEEGGFAGISNEHVTGLQWGTEERGRSGDMIFQPGSADSNVDNVFGYSLRGWPVPELGHGTSPIDAHLYSAGYDGENMMDEVLGIGVPSYSIPMEPGMLVAKSGRTTGVTTAHVESVGGMAEVEGYGSALFENVAFTDRSFSMGGDSGGLVVDNWKRSCGLVFAGSDRTTMICEATEIERLLGCQFGLAEPEFLDLRVQSLTTMPPLLWVPILVGGIWVLMKK